MKGSLKKILILAIAICLVCSALTLAACNDKKTTYTITVQCEDASVPDGVSAQLKAEDGTVAAEAALSAGVAKFKLPAANYTVSLEGLSEQFEYEEGALSAAVTSCTISLTKLNAYTITASYPALKDIYGYNFSGEGPAEGVKVELYEGELESDSAQYIEENGLTPAATKTTDANGRAVFYLRGNAYTIVFSEFAKGLEVVYPLGEVNTVTKSAARFDATFEQKFLYGASEDTALVFTVGENFVPLSYDLLTSTLSETSSAFYTFTPETSAKYTFSVTSMGKLEGEAFGEDGPLERGDSVTVDLYKGETYLFTCGIADAGAGTSGTLYHYNVNIVKGEDIPDKDPDEDPTNPDSSKATYTVTVLGRASDGTTTPLAGVKVYLNDDWENPSCEITDAQGKVTFTCAARPYSIRIADYPSNYVDDSDVAYSVSKDAPDLVITLTKLENFRQAAIAIKYANGSPAPSGLVVRLITASNSQIDQKTDADGVAHFEVPAGTYKVQIPLFYMDNGPHDNGPQLDSGQQFHDSKYTFTVGAQDVSMEASYSYTRKADITVRGAKAGAEVELVDEYNKSYSATVGANGVAHFDSVMEGDYEIYVNNIKKGDVTVEGGDASATVNA